jgi:hypothetical protein
LKIPENRLRAHAKKSSHFRRRCTPSDAIARTWEYSTYASRFGALSDGRRNTPFCEHIFARTLKEIPKPSIPESTNHNDVHTGPKGTTTTGPPHKGALIMDKKKEIVFFDDLGFGWLMDAEAIQKIREKESSQQILIQRSLAELFGRNKSA